MSVSDSELFGFLFFKRINNEHDYKQESKRNKNKLILNNYIYINHKQGDNISRKK